MRKRKESESRLKKIPASLYSQRMQKIQIELLLDIRELLILDSPTRQQLNLAKVKIISPEQAVDDLLLDLRKKKAKFCDACQVKMVFIKKYKNESGGEFHVYQCPKCKGKIDYAQIKGVGEFSVHTNIIPKEVKKKP